ncbi:MAG: hypothetical protein IJL69_04475 [Oscillospiraceae bacterium]|nr:hypothetical protein [Oscillospiraceae bacterium]
MEKKDKKPGRAERRRAGAATVSTPADREGMWIGRPKNPRGRTEPVGGDKR